MLLVGNKVDCYAGGSCATRRESGGLLGCAACWERGGLLVGRGLCCWSGERWTARRVMDVLLGARVVAVR